jgi:peptidyl-tRNA hydrolase ICT1
MLRLFSRPIVSSSLTWRTPEHLKARCFAAVSGTDEANEEDLQKARIWLDSLHAETIPKSICEMSFSRSSGPGGQNVNKYARILFVICIDSKHLQE